MKEEGIFFATSSEEEIRKNVLEGEGVGCAQELYSFEIEQGKVYRFSEGDPIIFSGKVLGYINTREVISECGCGFSFWEHHLVLLTRGGSLIFNSGDEDYFSCLELSKDQEDLPEIQ
ncbi:MAG: hypothetical protein KC516_02060 [Nanoarchaeota archaeon]|nr:hypothetical protein [Nanoarchaeota archaeon]